MEKHSDILQLSPTRRVKGAATCWYEPGPEVDVVADITKLPFRDGMFSKIYSFHVLEHLVSGNQSVEALKSWRRCLAPSGRLVLVNNDFEFICRSFIGGDISVDDLNLGFACPNNLTRESAGELIFRAGFPEGKVTFWFKDIEGEMEKADYELVLTADL